MQNISLITKTKITNQISENIIKGFPFSANNVEKNDEIELFLGRFPNEFYIIFADCYSIDGEDSMIGKNEKDVIPFDNGVVVELLYRNIAVAQYVVGVIAKFYPELFVICDERELPIAAEEYLKIAL